MRSVYAGSILFFAVCISEFRVLFQLKIENLSIEIFPVGQMPAIENSILLNGFVIAFFLQFLSDFARSE